MQAKLKHNRVNSKGELIIAGTVVDNKMFPSLGTMIKDGVAEELKETKKVEVHQNKKMEVKQNKEAK